ncbi:MAG: hypothetical protein ACHQF2_12425, partial [Flavobacteriales bacterium]
IVYTAKVKWRGLLIHYNAYMVVYADGKTESVSAMSKVEPPVLKENLLTWKWRNLEGTWYGSAEGIREDLLNNDLGKIDWNCFFPLAKAEIKISNKLFTGNGYCEKMEMSIPPWKLPINELYWGRFVSNNTYITWIEWKGPQPKKTLFINGKRTDNFELSNHGIVFGVNQLKFLSPKQVRKGNLASTVFKSFGWVKRIFPVKSLYMKEYKYTSGGELYTNGTLTEKGKTIYERVVL